MRIIASIIILPLFVCAASGQERWDALQQKMESQTYDIPNDKIYLHTDRNLYYPGDTIYFQTYIFDRFNQLAESSSSSSYVLLINSKNEIIDSARFKVKIFLSPGYLTLPDSLSPGYYRIVSYTSMMQNYDPGYTYSKWIRIEKLLPDDTRIGFSFHKESYQPGDTAKVTVKMFDKSQRPLQNESFTYSVMQDGKAQLNKEARTNNRGETLISFTLPDSSRGSDMSMMVNLNERNITKKQAIPLKSKKIDLRFLPEGGTYTFGLSQRLAFNALDHLGNQLYIKGIVKNDLGEVVDSIQSSAFGPGIVDFIPVEGRSYFAELDGYPDQRFSIPEPSVSVPVIRAELKGSSVIVWYRNPDENNTDYTLALVSNSEIIALKSMEGLKIKVIAFKLDELPKSTASILLFDSHLQPVAERMIQVNPHKKISAEIRPTHHSKEGVDETELEIKLKGADSGMQAGVMSVSVVDSATALYPLLPTSNIEDEFCFESNFYRNLPVSVRSNGLNNLTPAEMDILLLTYGWKKFTWKTINPENVPKQMEYYDQLRVEVKGRLNDRKKRRLLAKKDNLFLFSMEDSKISSLNRSSAGHYYLPIDSIGSNTSSVMVIPEGSSKNLINAITMDIPHSSGFTNKILEKNATPEFINENNVFIRNDFDIYGEDSRFIEEVSVTARRKPSEQFVNQHEKFYRLAPTTTLSGIDIKYAKDFETIMQIIAPNFRNAGLFYVLDGTPLGNDYMMLVDFPPNIIHSVTYLKRMQGYWMYGQNAKKGVIFVETKSNHYGDEYDYDYTLPNNSGFGTTKTIFRPVAEFYTPTLPELKANPENSKRNTLYWNYNLLYDGINPVKIKYPNNKISGTVKVFINGISENSVPFSQILTYELDPVN